MKSLIILAIKMKPAAGALARIVGKPTSEIGIGALLLGLGLYLSLATATVPTLMALGGCAALAAGTLQLRRRKEPADRRQPEADDGADCYRRSIPDRGRAHDVRSSPICQPADPGGRRLCRPGNNTNQDETPVQATSLGGKENRGVVNISS